MAKPEGGEKSPPYLADVLRKGSTRSTALLCMKTPFYIFIPALFQRPCCPFRSEDGRPDCELGKVYQRGKGGKFCKANRSPFGWVPPSEAYSMAILGVSFPSTLPRDLDGWL